jgi:hypothetical protein
MSRLPKKYASPFLNAEPNVQAIVGMVGFLGNKVKYLEEITHIRPESPSMSEANRYGGTERTISNSVL